MLMNDKIIFYRYYCINSAETKEIRCKNERNMVQYPFCKQVEGNPDPSLAIDGGLNLVKPKKKKKKIWCSIFYSLITFSYA